MDEVNPMAEMGFMHDKQVIIEPQGFMIPSDTIRDAAIEFLPEGAKFYDMLNRYSMVITYILNRDDTANNSDSAKLIAPFLKAFDISDYELKKFYETHLKLLPGAEKVMDYFQNTMPAFINTRGYEHAAHTLCERINMPIAVAGASMLELDNTNMSKQTAREMRRIYPELVKMKLSKMKYELDVPSELDDREINMISTLDGLFLKKLQGTEAMDMMQTMGVVGPNEKAYELLDIRKNTQVDLDGTIYIGGDIIDYQAMDLIKDGNGLSMSFNGTEFAVHGCNIAVLSEDCTVAAVLGAKFYDTGIQGVFDLVDNWNRDYLETMEFPDRNLVEDMLRRHPKTLPEVYHVTRSNVEEIAAKSQAYRDKLFKKNEYKKRTA